jgi:transcriptional regulator with XRE-family HTH domain
LAAKAGLNRASVYRLEGGAAPSRADTLFRIAHALDMPIRDLVPEWPEWEPIKGHGPGEGSRERRRALGLSLAQVAREIGVSEASLSRFERGVGTSPVFLRRFGDDVTSCNELLERVLGSGSGR